MSSEFPSLDALRVFMVSLRLGSWTVNTARAMLEDDNGVLTVGVTEEIIGADVTLNGSDLSPGTSTGEISFCFVGNCCRTSPSSYRRRNSLKAAASKYPISVFGSL